MDVGCGIGRMAVPLINYLTEVGSYDGFDIIKPNINWCMNNITPRFPHFRFQHVDIYNKHYNNTGTLQANTFSFPYPDESFNFVLLTSVFTHMLPVDLRHYLQGNHARAGAWRSLFHHLFFAE